ncbi:sugar-binding transcriptional regulator [Brevibacillus humidisoli]|uniref:sugar-binding transcriptional regulator n=1 Tax=Brevibacillus humidisoli TaxID=2895522 RepID=UPI001E373527|nr:sugar-binding transcriptional regulator [Brevibacillus humidisoli]UFJ39796.1 sugar-binding transcriptional regulator [Brevibacillus humidisoli]
MGNLVEERKRLLVKVSKLYYVDGLNQQEIAERLRISRPNVSRMLSEARSEGIVTITIKNPYEEEQQLERAIAETFGIHDVIVHNISDNDPKLIERQLALAGAALLETTLKDRDIVGVMAGRATASLGREAEYFPRKGLQFVPLVGGWGIERADWHANTNARVLGETFKSKYWQLNAPAVVSSKETRDALLNEPEIQEVLGLARQSTVALLGIGQLSEQATIVKSGYLKAEELRSIEESGAVANLCASFLNDRGEILELPVSARMIGVTLPELRRQAQVIGIASGEDKVAAITATLRGKWIDVLVTDYRTAKAILEWNRTHPVES